MFGEWEPHARDQPAVAIRPVRIKQQFFEAVL